jgi:hypothetical protein
MRFANSVVLLDPPVKPAPPKQQQKAPPKGKAKAGAKQQPGQQAQPQQQQQAYSFMCKAFYNVENGALYCTKKQNPFTRVQELGLERPMTTVMRKLDGTIVINTNKPVQVRPSASTRESVAAQPQRSFLFNDRHMREQTERKLEWLMQTTAHEALGGAHEAEEPQQSGGDESAGGSAGSPTKKGGGGKKKDGIKKLINQPIDDVIVRPGHDCQSPLMCVNILGIMKNGKVACTKCSLMTEMTNRNMTADGSVVCGLHKPVEPPADKTHCKYQIHPRDVAAQGRPCFFCHMDGARMRVAVQDDQLALRKLQICKECFDVSRASSRAEVTPLCQLARRLAK